MNKYQVTMELVVEVEADTEAEAWDMARGPEGIVVEENITECVVIEFRCAECHEDMDPYNDDCYDGAMCQKCEEEVEEV